MEVTYIILLKELLAKYYFNRATNAFKSYHESAAKAYNRKSLDEQLFRSPTDNQNITLTRNLKYIRFHI
jgi:hypothetical protein